MTASPRGGFTLVELLTALLAFGLIAAAGASLLGAGVAAREAAGESVDRLARLQRMRALLAADLGQLSSRRVRGADGGARPEALESGEHADGTVLRLTRSGWTNPERESRASLQRVEYRLVDGRLERWSFARLDGGPPEPPLVLIDDAGGVRVSFLSDGREDDGWRATPDRPLPDAVRVTMTLPRYGVLGQLFLVGP